MLGNTSRTWQQIVWMGAALALLVVIGALIWFVGATVTDLVAVLKRRHQDEPFFVLSGVALITLTLIRMLAILIGGAICFAGLAVSFLTHQQQTSVESAVNRGEQGAKLTLATYSPGIVAMIIGAAIIVFALYARTSYSSKGVSAPIAGAVERTVEPAEQPEAPAPIVPRAVDQLSGQDEVPKPIE